MLLKTAISSIFCLMSDPLRVTPSRYPSIYLSIFSDSPFAASPKMTDPPSCFRTNVVPLVVPFFRLTGPLNDAIIESLRLTIDSHGGDALETNDSERNSC
jgi:hypothetical protein